jgi:hypothetical protein
MNDVREMSGTRKKQCVNYWKLAWLIHCEWTIENEVA